ncbi:MAG: ATP-binding protein [Burkholderiales bacterium]|nr:ATP-binding protein [Burkholderiales bacterium]
MYIQREEQAVVSKVSGQFKTLLVTGPRQVGKSTMLKHVAPGRPYISLDLITARELADSDPSLFLQRYKPPVLIDEIQYAPNLFPAIKSIVDQDENNGLFWLTGSQQFHLMQHVSESLAGRIAILRLLGLSQRELEGWLKQKPFLPTENYLESCRNRTSIALDKVFHFIWKGSYPTLWTADVDWEIFYDSYFQTYLQRDVRNLTKVSNEMEFVRFVRAVAGRIGQQINFNSLANDVGISQPTAKAWLSVLEASGLVYFLPPYFNNRLKRLVKSPKLYFTDTGLASFLSGWLTEQALEAGTMSGAFLENYAIIEILKGYRNIGREPSLYYYRDTDGREIDLIIEEAGMLYPIEIKKTSSPRASMVKSFDVLPKEVRGKGALLSFVNEDVPLSSNVSAVPFFYL